MDYDVWKLFVPLEVVPVSFATTWVGYDFFKKSDEPQRLSDVVDNIESSINDSIKKTSKVGVLAGGGVDSTFLIVILQKNGFKNVNCISYRKDGSDAECEYIDQLCKKFGYEHSVVSPTDDQLILEYDHFRAVHGRSPRDVVALIHSFLCNQLRSQDCDYVLDGQYADSVLNMNPQLNVIKFFMRSNALRRLVGLVRFSLNVLVEFNKVLRSRLIKKINKKALYFQGKNTEELVLQLCRIEINHESRALCRELISRYGILSAHLRLFNNVLLRFREGDKYKLHEVISPFKQVPFHHDTAVKKVEMIKVIEHLGGLPFVGSSASFTPGQ